MSNRKQNLQKPFQPRAADCDFSEVLPKGFFPGGKHHPGLIGDLRSLGGCVLQVAMVDLRACLLGFQLCWV